MKDAYKLVIIFFRENTWLLVFLFSFAIIFGPSFGLFSEFNYNTPDIHDYVKISQFDFDQSPIRRYRVIIPLLASGINYIFEPIFSVLKPFSFPGPGFSICMSFFIVNTVLMSIYGTVIFYLSKAYGVSTLGATIGLLSVLTSRWTAYIAGLPVVDSLYLLVIALSLLGIKTKSTKLIIFSILLGPWAKESFIFIAPLIFFYSHVNKWKQVILFIISGGIVFLFRYSFDLVNGLDTSAGLTSNVNHFNYIFISLKRLFSFHGIYEVFSIIGIWSLLFLTIIKKEIRNTIIAKSPSYSLLFIVIVIIHALLSTDLARMFYLLTPLLSIWISILVDALGSSYNNNKAELDSDNI